MTQAFVAATVVAGLGLGALGVGCQTSSEPPAVRAAVSQRVLRTLFVDGEPGWEYRYLSGHLCRSPRVRTQCFLSSAEPGFLAPCSEGLDPLATLPPPSQWSQRYDLVILGDLSLSSLAAGWQQEALACKEAIRAYVQGGGALLLRPFTSIVDLVELAGVQLSDTGHAQDRLVRGRSRAAWDREVPLEGLWLDRVLPVEPFPATQVLARSEKDQPLVLMRVLGKGQVWTLPFEGSWRWRVDPGSPAFYAAFWDGVVTDIVARAPAPEPAADRAPTPAPKPSDKD